MSLLTDDDISKLSKLNGHVMANKQETVNHPSHYISGKYETIDVIEEWTKTLKGCVAFCIGNSIKYLARWTKKNGVEDLKKARWYLDKAIATIEKDDNDGT